MIQTYPKIQLIIADDCSNNLDEEKVRHLFEKLNSKRSNPIDDLILVRADKNMGTAVNLHSGYKHCVGEFVTQFAGDDQFHDEHALENYYRALKNVEDDACGVVGIAYRCDEKLNYRNAGEVIDPSFGFQMNEYSADRQYGELCSYCHFFLGATAFIRTRLETIPNLSYEYHMLEDWPIFLSATGMGWKFIYFQKPILDYRMGGVSQSNTLTKARSICFYETKKLFEQRIIPKSGRLNDRDFLNMATQFDFQRYQILKYGIAIKFPRRIWYLFRNFTGAIGYFRYNFSQMVGRRTISSLISYVKFLVMEK